MLLKKQTVWLLTMLSLVVVLSVYYITSPEQRGQNLATLQEEVDKEKEAANMEIESDGDSAIITNASEDEIFTALRLQLNEERDKRKEDLTIRMGSTDLPPEEISAAKDEYNRLDEIAQKEEMLETLIKAMNYEDVLVRADGPTVLVTVKAKELSRSAANDIIREVTNEIGDLQLVTVEFQPPK